MYFVDKTYATLTFIGKRVFMKSSMANNRDDRRPPLEPRGRGLVFRSLFMHLWDFVEDDPDAVMTWVREAGLNTMCVAGSYHSGWFIHPSSRTHRFFRTEGSVSYFRPQNALWKKLRLRPKMSELCVRKDWLAEVGKRLSKHELQLVSWTIGCHNSHLGLMHPELTPQNVYGDRMPHALCPAQADVRAYLLTLCRDLATNYPLWAIQLEAFGWMNAAHGHHHERDLVGLADFEQKLISLCFCPACTDAAGRSGVDVAALKAALKTILDGAFREAPDRPKGHPQSVAEVEDRFPELKKFEAWRRTFLASLIHEVKSEALDGTDCRLLLQSGYDAELASGVDGFACGAYQKTPLATLAIAREAKRDAVGWNGLLQCFVQLGMGVPRSERQLRELVEAVVKGGCNGINFYNRSEAPPKMLDWLKNVLPAFENTPEPNRPSVTKR